jgi:hypothetical protein
MLQSISSPRREAASPPHQDVPYSKKANTLGTLQLHFVNAVTECIQGLCLGLFLNGRVIGGAGGDVGRRGDEEDSIWRWICDWGGSDEVMPLISVPKLKKMGVGQG